VIEDREEIVADPRLVVVHVAVENTATFPACAHRSGLHGFGSRRLSGNVPGL